MINWVWWLRRKWYRMMLWRNQVYCFWWREEENPNVDAWLGTTHTDNGVNIDRLFLSYSVNCWVAIYWRICEKVLILWMFEQGCSEKRVRKFHGLHIAHTIEAERNGHCVCSSIHRKFTGCFLLLVLIASKKVCCYPIHWFLAVCYTLLFDMWRSFEKLLKKETISKWDGITECFDLS